jgi:molybdenum cofactor cytidylyltransferase
MICAIILAAGKSTRMGQPKMLMPWGDTTVLGAVIRTMQHAGVGEIVLVTNALIAANMTDAKIQVVENDNGEMLESLKAGIAAVRPSAEAALICLGDQPQVEERSVRSVCEAYQKSKVNLVVPSYHMRRGHPWLIARGLWDEILHMREDETMRDLLNNHKDEILYVECDTPSILQDLDTPDDYLKYKPTD